MSHQRISGKDFYTHINGAMIHVESASLSIEDGSGVAMTNGIPNGWVDGETKAEGELELDSQNFILLSTLAAQAGSWKGIQPFDLLFAASTHESLEIEAFGCKLKINDLLDKDSKGGEKSTHKLTFDVASPDFVRINGVPYLDSTELTGVVQ